MKKIMTDNSNIIKLAVKAKELGFPQPELNSNQKWYCKYENKEYFVNCITDYDVNLMTIKGKPYWKPLAHFDTSKLFYIPTFEQVWDELDKINNDLLICNKIGVYSIDFLGEFRSKFKDFESKLEAIMDLYIQIAEQKNKDNKSFYDVLDSVEENEDIDLGRQFDLTELNIRQDKLEKAIQDIGSQIDTITRILEINKNTVSAIYKLIEK